MSARSRLVFGIVCGVLAAGLVLVYATSVHAEEQAAREEALARYGGEQVEACVATRDIAAGEKISAGDVKSQLWLADLLPADSITRTDEVIGATTRISLLANEPISRAHLGQAASAIEVPDGLCAVSIPAQDVSAVGGAVTKGTKVNVYSTTDNGVVLLGEDLLVLDTSNATEGEDVLGGSPALSWVTLAVSPDSVQQILTASERETLYLALPAQASSAGDARKDKGDADAKKSDTEAQAAAGAQGDNKTAAGSTSADSADKKAGDER